MSTTNIEQLINKPQSLMDPIATLIDIGYTAIIFPTGWISVLVLTFVLTSITWRTFLVPTSKKSAARLPPGPKGYPILGNILEMGSKPHRSLAKLSKKYGPIMSLKLGSLTTIVVSSPELAKEVLQTNDLAFSSRSIRTAAEAHDHSKYSMVWLPVDSLWRKLRKICKEQMFSVPSLEATRGLRKEKLEKLSDYLKECSRAGQAVDIGDAAFTTSLNLLSATLFSQELASYNSGSSHEIKGVVTSVFKCVGSPNLSDFFPILKPFDPQGMFKETVLYFQKFYSIVDGIVDEKLKSRARSEKTDKSNLLETLLDLHQKDEPELSREVINHLLLDLFMAGTDTTSGTVEWTMAELIRNPTKMSRLKSEIRNIVGQREQVEESDISRLPYLQALVKETFRLHAVVPFLVPHKAQSATVVNGYTIPKNAQILVNVWASGRDSSIWKDAELFMPERFLDDSLKDIDFRGHDFELIPFGAGRRICPALPLANRMVPLMIATFVHNMEWKLENGIAPEELDMTDKFGLSVLKALPLRAIPISDEILCSQ